MLLCDRGSGLPKHDSNKTGGQTCWCMELLREPLKSEGRAVGDDLLDGSRHALDDAVCACEQLGFRV
jgi:hypothetical protein